MPVGKTSSCTNRFGGVEMRRFADDPILTAGFQYWFDLPRQLDVPDRVDVDPAQMPRAILPNVALLETIEDGADVRIRLAGQEFDDNFGFRLKGRRMSDLTQGDYRAYILDHLRLLGHARGAIYSESAFRWDRGGQLRTRRIMMPLSHGEPGVIAMILAVQTWPREKMRGLPFCDAVADSTGISNSEPDIVRGKAT
jgi:hypothetical protein